MFPAATGRTLRHSAIAIVTMAAAFGAITLAGGQSGGPSALPANPTVASGDASRPTQTDWPPNMTVDPANYYPEGANPVQYPTDAAGAPVTPYPYSYVNILGKVVPLPEGAHLGSVITENPELPEYFYVQRGESKVSFTADRIVEWLVAPEDEGDFHVFRKAFQD